MNGFEEHQALIRAMGKAFETQKPTSDPNKEVTPEEYQREIFECAGKGGGKRVFDD